MRLKASLAPLSAIVLLLRLPLRRCGIWSMHLRSTHPPRPRGRIALEASELRGLETSQTRKAGADRKGPRSLARSASQSRSRDRAALQLSRGASF
jgi:hypothetical protein